MKNTLIVASLLVILPSMAFAACGGVSAQVTDGGNLLTAAADAPGCDGLTLDLKEGDCLGATINGCTVAAGACRVEFSPPWAAGAHAYVFCLDEDGDGMYEMSSDASIAAATQAAVKNPDGSMLVLPLMAIAFVIALIMYLKGRKRKAKRKAKSKKRRK